MRQLSAPQGGERLNQMLNPVAWVQRFHGADRHRAIVVMCLPSVAIELRTVHAERRQQDFARRVLLSESSHVAAGRADVVGAGDVELHQGPGEGGALLELHDLTAPHWYDAWVEACE